MEEDKRIRRKKIFKLISKILTYTLLSILLIILGLLILYVLSTKIAEKKGEMPPYGLYTIISPSMTPNINVYDVVIVKKVDTSTLKIGDIITFYSTNEYFGNTPITHRIVEIIEKEDGSIVYRVKGDYNDAPDKELVLSSNILGRVRFRIPQLGRVQFYLASKGGWIIAILIPALAVIAYDIYKILRLFLLKSKILSLKNDNGNI